LRVGGWGLGVGGWGLWVLHKQACTRANTRTITHVELPPCPPTVKLAAKAPWSNVIVSGSDRLVAMTFDNVVVVMVVVMMMMMPKVAEVEGRGKLTAICERG